MKRVFLSAAAVWLGGVLRLAAQNPTQTPQPSPTPTPTPGAPTTTAGGVRYATESAANVNGVKVQVAPDGSVWFLEASADRVGVLRGTTITYWQLRPSDNLGANPVDFKLDGTNVWLLESGQSLIPAGRCSIGKLDTTTNQLTEWTIPGSLPAAFYQAPDGTWWIPITGAALLNTNFDTGVTTVYRSPLTYAYSDMTVAPDGTLWMADFGNNRIVKYKPGDTTETSWTFYDPSQGRLNPTQIRFDDSGKLWLSQISASRMDRFDPATGVLDSFYGMSNPIHFDMYQGRLYITSGQAAAAVNVLDPKLAQPFSGTLTPLTLDVRTTQSAFPVVSRTIPIAPTTFSTEATTLDNTQFVVAGNASFPGALVTQVPVDQAYGITVDGGRVWFGAGGNLARVDLQTIGGPTDRSVPVANSIAGQPNDRIRIDITLSNKGAAAVTGQALYLYSPGAFAAKATFAVPAGGTQVLQDAFGNIGAQGNLASGAVRIQVSAGNVADLETRVRTTRVLPNGSSYGYAVGGETIAASLNAGDSGLLFTGARTTEASVLGMYTMVGAAGTLTLSAPDGSVRGTRPFEVALNTREEFNPAAAAFGVSAEPGDTVTVSVTSGTLQPYVNILDLGTLDVAASLPVHPHSDFVIPNAGVLVGVNATSFVTDLYLSNPSTTASADLTITYYALYGTGEPLTQSVTLAPLESRTIENVLLALYGLTGAQGSLLVSSTTAVAAAVRVGARSSGGDFAGIGPVIDGASGIAGASATSFGLPQTSFRRTNLLLYNRGFSGTVTVTGIKADGTTAGSVQVPLGDHAPGRLNSVFASFGITNQAGGRIRIDVPAGMNVYAWTAEVDGISGDVDLFPVPP